MNDDFIVGKERRRIEDSIVARFNSIDFNQRKHAYLEQEDFWDFVFSWYELYRYYELSEDTTIGAHMLELFTYCGTRFKEAAHDRKLKERRRDKAADALYQITYYVNKIIIQAERNGLEKEDRYGEINWKQQSDDHDPSPNLN